MCDNDVKEVNYSIYVDEETGAQRVELSQLSHKEEVLLNILL